MLLYDKKNKKRENIALKEVDKNVTKYLLVGFL